MPRPPRADEAGGLYHALNRGNLQGDIFREEGDFLAFEKILHLGLQRFQIERFSDQLPRNHYHLVLRPLIVGQLSRFMGWIGGTQTMCSYVERSALRAEVGGSCRRLALGIAVAMAPET